MAWYFRLRLPLERLEALGVEAKTFFLPMGTCRVKGASGATGYVRGRLLSYRREVGKDVATYLICPTPTLMGGRSQADTRKGASEPPT